MCLDFTLHSFLRSLRAFYGAAAEAACSIQVSDLNYIKYNYN